MMYLIPIMIALLGLAISATTTNRGDHYGQFARLVEVEGGQQFALYPYTTIGGSADIDLTLYGCASNLQVAAVSSKNGSYYLSSGSASADVSQLRRNGELVSCQNREVRLEPGDQIRIVLPTGRILKFKFERE